jgi:hypothetical protein
MGISHWQKSGEVFTMRHHVMINTALKILSPPATLLHLEESASIILNMAIVHFVELMGLGMP